MEYFTGGNYVPFGGFDNKIKVAFYTANFTSGDKSVICDKLPSVKTCNLTFNCPRNFPSYNQLEKTMAFCILECKQFGDY